MRHSIEYARSAGILTCCPSTTPFSLALGPTNPGLINMAQETLDFRRAGISPALWLLIPTFSLPYTSRSVTLPLQRVWDALLPRYRLHRREETKSFFRSYSREAPRPHPIHHDLASAERKGRPASDISGRSLKVF